MDGAIYAAIITSLVTCSLWALDRFHVLSALRSTKFNFDGRWRGISEFVASSSTTILNAEQFFELDVDINQHGRRFSVTEKITSIRDGNLNALPMRAAREFSGKGTITNDINLRFDLSELGGLTVGSGYLVADTWGKTLRGYLIVRNENSDPVIVSVRLARSEIADEFIQKELNRTTADQRNLTDSNPSPIKELAE